MSVFSPLIGSSARETQTKETPLPPSIMPVVFISGTEYEMGYQYGLQLAQSIELIKNEEWVRALTTFHGEKDEIMKELKACQWHVKKYAPEQIDRMKGMADGATQAGHSMTFADILLINARVHKTGDGARYPSPVEDLGSGCSVWAAWGKATKDGSLIVGDSKDDVYTYQVVTVAFPKEGNNYITTGRPGELSQHSSMNDRGLHVGANGTSGERAIDRTYGLPYSCALLRLVQFADSAAEAKEMVLSWDLYWIRGLNFNLVDEDGNAFCVETTGAQKEVRKSGDFGEKDFIYSTNIYLTGKMKPLDIGSKMMYLKNSPSRNEQIHSFLTRYHGKIDPDFAKMMWRNPGYGKIGNLANHRIVISLPRKGDKGTAYFCSGTASKEAYPAFATGCGPFPGSIDNPDRSGHSYVIAPTYSFYKLALASNPAEVAQAAAEAAHDVHAMAFRELSKLNYNSAGYSVLTILFSESVAEYYKGKAAENRGFLAEGNPALSYFSAAATAYARAQALGMQVYNALVPPAATPQDLGLPS
jgi:hypothetical protein